MTSTSRPSFTLSGPSIELDARTHAVRGDLADIALAGKLFVPHYAQPMEMTCSVESVALLATPDASAVPVGDLTQGAIFKVVDIAGGWAWGFRAADHLVGYVALTALGPAK